MSAEEKDRGIRMRGTVGVAALWLALGGVPSAQTPPTTDSQQAARRGIESFLRFLYAWGPDTQVSLGPMLESRLPGVYSVLVQVTHEGRQLQDVILTSADGRYLIRGDFFDTAENPFAEALAGIRLSGFPSQGPPEAAVVIVEYADLQCPDCREMAPALQAIVKENPAVRLVWKDLPLTQIHKWAMSAHLAARCVYEQSPEGFWQVHDYIFENQDQLTLDNLNPRLENLARQQGLDLVAYRACRNQELSRAIVEQSIQEARALGVSETPTLFINGRRLAGSGPEAARIIQRLVEFEMHIGEQGSVPP